MGGATLPVVREERGAYFDLVTWDLVQEVKRLSGSLYINPMDGCGCFQGRSVQLEDGRVLDLGETGASADTHEGEGAGDIAVSSDEEGRIVETLFRMVGCAAWYRPLVSPYSGRKYGWARHVHFLRIGARLSPAAQEQVKAYLDGLNGLAVPHPDTGTRKYVGVTWASYLANKQKTQEEDPLAAITLAQIVEGILDAQIKHPDPKRTDTSSLQSWITRSTLEAIGANAKAAAALARVAALEAVVKTLAANPAATPEQIEAAAKAGAEAALAEKISDADVTLNVTA